MDVKTLVKRLEELNGQFVGGDLVELTIVPASKTLLAAIKNRVRNQGLGSDGSALRKYSTKPIYATKNQFIKGGFQPQGKSMGVGDRLVPTVRLKSTSVKKNPVRYKSYTQVKPNYKPRQGMYLPEGYKELRDIQGLRTDITNMSYSGKMLSDYVQVREGDTVLLGINDKLSADKYLGNTARRGYFLQASAKEIEDYIKQTTFAITRLTVGLLKNGEVITATINQLT